MVISLNPKKPKSAKEQKGSLSRIYRLDYSPSKDGVERQKQFTVKQYRNRFRKFEFNTEIPHRQLFLPKNFVQNHCQGMSQQDILSCICFLGVIYLITQLKDSIHKRLTYADIHSYAICRVITLSSFSASPLIALMKSLGLLESDKSYQIGVKSTGYRIGPALRDLEWEEFDYDTFYKENIQGKTHPNFSKAAPILWARASQYFTTWHSLPEGETKEICRKTAEILKTVKVDDSIELQRKLQSAAESKEAKNLKNGKDSWNKTKIFAGYKAGIDAINQGKTYVTVHQDTQRFFSNVTNLKKEAREQLMINGEKLISVDIATCQAALLAVLYQNTPADCAERAKYIKDITEKDIYTEAGGAGSSREDNKTNFFVLMFAKVWSHKGATFDKVKEKYPILVQRITEMKKNYGYRSVSRLLQQNEASIMINGALSELLTAGLSVLSCHDSILCLPKDLARVKECITQHFFKAMNFAPVLKVD